jgi:tetratricopeptide (TPR) repeat protein
MVLLCTITYLNHFENAFHFDDSHTIQNNAYIRDLHNIPLYFRDGRTSSSLPQNQSYRPVVSTSLAFDYWLGGGYDLFFFHLSTFILFLLQGILMVFFFKKIFNTATPNTKLAAYTALIATTWYLLHPAIAETVNYIIARADLQSTLCVLLAFVLYIYSPFWRKTYLYNLPIVIGTLAKPPSVIFAPLLFLYILLFEEQLSLTDIFRLDKFKQLLAVIKRSAPAFIVCLLMYYWQAKFTPTTWEAGGTSPLSYLITQPFVMLHYFAMLFVPNALSADTDWQLLHSMADWRFFVGMTFVLSMIAIAFVTSRKAQLRPISFGILWFFLALLPTSSIIPLAEVLNDHRMFFPFVGLIISVVWTIALLIKAWLPLQVKNVRITLMVVLVLTLSAYAYGTYQRNEVWYTEETLWHDVTIKSPDNGRGLMNYGLSKMAKGDYVTAAVYYEKALKLLPYYPSLYINMGILKAATGHAYEAERYFKTGIAYGNSLPDAYLFYGRYLKEQKRYFEAIPQFEKALMLSPGHLYAINLLMDTYLEIGNWDALKEMANNTLQISPGNKDALYYLDAANKKTNKLDIEADKVKAAPTAQKYLDLSLQYYQTGKYQQCIDAATQAIRLKPDYAEAYNNIGSAYNLLQQYDKAIAALKKAIALKPGFQLAKNNLTQAQQELAGQKH